MTLFISAQIAFRPRVRIINISMGLQDQLSLQGYAILDGSKYLDLLDTENIEFLWAEENQGKHLENDVKLPSKNKEAIDKALLFIQVQIAQDILEPISKSYRFKGRMVWEGAAKNAANYHSDCRESNNIFFLFYFNDIDDGAVWFKNYDGEHRIPSRKGALIAVENTNPDFQHRAEPTNNRRVVASFSYFVEW